MASDEEADLRAAEMFGKLFKADAPECEAWLESLRCFSHAQRSLSKTLTHFGVDEPHKDAKGHDSHRGTQRARSELMRLDGAMAELDILLRHTLGLMSEFDLAWPMPAALGEVMDPLTDQVMVSEQAVLMSLRMVSVRADELEHAAAGFIGWRRGLVPTSLRQALEDGLDELWVSIVATDKMARDLNALATSWSDRKRAVARQN